MVCPMRIIVIAVSIVVAVALALIAFLSDEEIIAPPEQHDKTDNEEIKEKQSVTWQIVDFMNGKFLWRQFIRCRGSKQQKEKE